MTKNKDFIDFLIELVHKKNLFFIILLLCLSYATYFEFEKNDKYKFETTIGIALESSLLPIINNINVYKTQANSYLTPIRTTINYEEFSEQLCSLVKTTFVDDSFYSALAEDFMSKNVNDILYGDIFDNLKGSIELPGNPNKEIVCMVVEFTSTPEYISYLQKNYQIMLNSYLQRELATRNEILRTGQIERLSETLGSTKTAIVDPSRSVVLDKLELNSIEERKLSFRNLLELVRNTEIIDTKINYIIVSSSAASKTLNNIFIYVFSVFVSIIFFVLTVVLIEFKDQYKFRNSLND
jgi:hypothetical protein